MKILTAYLASLQTAESDEIYQELTEADGEKLSSARFVRQRRPPEKLRSKTKCGF